jgi:dTDP-4-dehydrorhamnose reductase
LTRELERRGAELCALDRAAADVTDRARVNEAVRSFRPDVIFNCAAYTKVDDCEREVERARAVNATAVGHLASAAKSAGAQLVHVSTDFVFDGAQRVPYQEESRTAPLQVYGQTKAEGEREALRFERAVVVRTSWVFGPGGASFVATILRLLTRPEPIRVVDDQVGCPTYAPYLASALIALAERGARGIVHYRNEGPISWHGFAVEIARRVAPGRAIAPCTTADFPRPARRPAYSVLDVERYEAIVAPVEPWRRGLDECLNTVAGVGRSAPPGRGR